MKPKLKEQYESDGFVVVENLFTSQEVTSFKQEIQRIISEVQREGTANGNDFSNGVYVGLATKSDIFKNLASDSRIVSALKEIIGDNIMFLSDKAVAKTSSKDFASPWHQDWPYWKGSNKLSVWIALDDATPDNGCLKIIPGSHRATVEHEQHVNSKEGFGNRLRAEDIDENKAIAVPVKAGAVIIFHDLTFHSSYKNISGKDRWALISTYKDAMLEDPDYAWANPILVSTNSKSNM